MTVPVEKPFYKFTYTGPGDFPIDFTIINDIDIKVTHYIPDTSIVKLVLGQDYTLTFKPYEKPTLHLLYDAPPYEGDIQVRRDIPVTQDTDWINQGPFDQELIERNLDKLTMIIQDTLFLADYDVNRSWRGQWKPRTAYNMHDMITGPKGSIYELTVLSALVTHESSDSFEQDFDAGFWRIAIDMTALYELAEQVEEDADRAELARNQALSYADSAVVSAQESAKYADTSEQYAIQAGSFVGKSAFYADKAKKWAENPVDVPIEGSEYSAYHWARKAAEFGGINKLSTSDTDMLLIQEDPDNPKHKIIHINSDTPFGIPKLDNHGNIRFDQLPTTLLHLIGPLAGDDVCPKPGDEEGDCTEPDYRNPSERWPGTNWPDGAYFIITSSGNMNLMDASGNYVVTPVNIGDAVIYVKDGVVLPEGWYYVQGDQLGDIVAASVIFDDSYTIIKGSNVQSWNQAADAEIAQCVRKGEAIIEGDVAIRDTDPELLFYETDYDEYMDDGQRWRFYLNGLQFNLQSSAGNNWRNILNMDPFGIITFAVLPRCNTSTVNYDDQLITKQYADDNFLNTADGGVVYGEVTVSNFLSCNNTFRCSNVFLRDGGGLVAGYANTDVLTYFPSSGKAEFTVPLHLPANVGVTDPQQPPL